MNKNKSMELRDKVYDVLMFKERCHKCGYDRCKESLKLINRIGPISVISPGNGELLKKRMEERVDMAVVCPNCFEEILHGKLDIQSVFLITESNNFNENLKFKEFKEKYFDSYVEGLQSKFDTTQKKRFPRFFYPKYYEYLKEQGLIK